MQLKQGSEAGADAEAVGGGGGVGGAAHWLALHDLLSFLSYTTSVGELGPAHSNYQSKDSQIYPPQASLMDVIP